MDDALKVINGQLVILCDEDGKPTGEYSPRLDAHTGEGKKHLAITVVLINSKGEMLLQKRKHRICDNLWDLTASTDLLHKEDGTDETPEEATSRALGREYYLRDIPVKVLGGFSYFAKSGEYCENEYDNLLAGNFDGDVTLNPEVGYEYKWVSKEEFLADILKNPTQYTPWTVMSTELIKNGF